MLEVGSVVPEFTLEDQHGAPVTWSSLRGAPVVFFFYPRADTPGCTKEACAFRDLAAEFGAIGVRVFGISADTVKKQRAFDEKYSLGVPLLSDPDRVVINPWGVWGSKTMYGKAFEGIVRSTFLFDAAGRVIQAWPKVKVEGHVDEVLAAARAHVSG
jgi:peroxiredoxin Q/BCP